MQLAEHAQAILADDAALGISRADPLLSRLATKELPGMQVRKLLVVFKLKGCLRPSPSLG